MSQVEKGQRGYVGTEISVRGKEAIDQGIMPISKWTKATIIDQMVANHWSARAVEEARNLPAKELKEKALRPVGWHHTSRWLRRTTFYRLISESDWVYLLYTDLFGWDDKTGLGEVTWFADYDSITITWSDWGWIIYSTKGENIIHDPWSTGYPTWQEAAEHAEKAGCRRYEVAEWRDGKWRVICKK